MPCLDNAEKLFFSAAYEQMLRIESSENNLQPAQSLSKEVIPSVRNSKADRSRTY